MSQLHYQMYLVQDTNASENGNYDAGWLATCNCGRDFWMGGKGTKVEIQNQINHHLAQVNVTQPEVERDLLAQISVLEKQVESLRSRIAQNKEGYDNVAKTMKNENARLVSKISEMADDLQEVYTANAALTRENDELRESLEDANELIEDTIITPGYRSRAGRTSYVVYTRRRDSVDPEDYATTYWPDEHTARIDYAAHKDNDFYKELLKQSTVTYTYSVLLENNEHE